MRPAWLVLTGTLLAVGTPAMSRAADLKDVFAGDTAPLTLKLKDLRPGWYRVSLGGLPDAGGGNPFSALAGGIFGAMFGGGAPSAPAPPAYYTQGQTVVVASETFLITYRSQLKGLDMAALMKAGPEAKLPPPERLTPDSALALVLVNLKGVSSLTDIRPFNMEQELEESRKAAESEAALREQFGKGLGAFGGAVPPGAVPEPVVEAPPPTTKPAPAPKKTPSKGKK